MKRFVLASIITIALSTATVNAGPQWMVPAKRVLDEQDPWARAGTATWSYLMAWGAWFLLF